MSGRCLLRAAPLLLAIAVAMAGQFATATEGQRYKDEIFPAVRVTRDIAYGQALDEHGQVEILKLDLYEPEGDTEALRPAYVWIHGGGFTGGDKADALNAEIATRFAQRGYVAASINYRLREGEYFVPEDPRLPEVIREAQNDSQAAVRWLRANAAAYRIDGLRIAVGGSSAGAIAALFVNYNASESGDSGNPGYPSNTSAGVSISGNMATSFMGAGEPPVLVVHGTEDTRVPYQGALNIVARGAEVGVIVEFHSLEGIGHLVWWTIYKEDIIFWMSDFLFRYVASPSVGGVVEVPAHSRAEDTEVALLPIVGAIIAGSAVVLSVGWAGAKLRRRG